MAVWFRLNHKLFLVETPVESLSYPMIHVSKVVLLESSITQLSMASRQGVRKWLPTTVLNRTLPSPADRASGSLRLLAFPCSVLPLREQPAGSGSRLRFFVHFCDRTPVGSVAGRHVDDFEEADTLFLLLAQQEPWRIPRSNWESTLSHPPNKNDSEPSLISSGNKPISGGYWFLSDRKKQAFAYEYKKTRRLAWLKFSYKIF